MREAQSTETNVMDPAQTAGMIVTILAEPFWRNLSELAGKTIWQ